MLTLGSLSRAAVSSIFRYAGERSQIEIAPSRLPLVVDDVEQQAIDGHRVGAEEDAAWVEDVARVRAKGPPCHTPRRPSMICSTVRERSGSTEASVPTNE